MRLQHPVTAIILVRELLQKRLEQVAVDARVGKLLDQLLGGALAVARGEKVVEPAQ